MKSGLKMTNFPKQSAYPKEIYITNIVYKLKFVKGMKIYGDTNPSKQLIRIKAGISPRATFLTFIHEVLHMLHFEHDFKLKHKQVYELEKAIFELLVDNFL